MESFLNGRVILRCGDNRAVMGLIADCSIHSIVTDPPYALVSIVKRFGKLDSAPAKGNEAYKRASAGFMGKQWDTGEVAFDPTFWADCLRVLKPGGHLIAFSGTRTYHRMVVAIEDAGFEVRDQIGWIYGSGFPKSHNIGDGWGTALKPAWEPIVLARKPFSGTIAGNVLEHGAGAINIDGCRIASGPDHAAKCASVVGLDSNRNGDCYGEWSGARADSYSPAGRWPANLIHDGSEEVIAAFPESQDGIAVQRNGGGQKIGGSGIYQGSDGLTRPDVGYGSGGSAARFFYTAKADADDRVGSKHPTVKPIDLMQWLCRLVTPKGGTILDPFAGTGTTGEAAF